jgi:hypothetical protein
MRSPAFHQTWRQCMSGLVFGSLAMLAVGVHAAESDVQEIDDTWRAQIQKDKIKQHRFESSHPGAAGESGKCGQVDIGNDKSPKGSRSVAARDKTVIVLGPVINVAKCR